MSDDSPPVGVLLVQLGTPASPAVRDVRGGQGLFIGIAGSAEPYHHESDSDRVE